MVLAIDAVHACIWPDGFGISVASLVLVANTTLLGLYTFSCHSLRHLVGGKVDCFSCVAMGHSRHKLWKGVSKLNTNHMLWAWTSLFMVMFADLYVWMVSSGVWTDSADHLTMERYPTHQYDVVVVGAGGAGLRAAIEAARSGAKTAIICKSLLGKAHTVMAEGGVAAALANVDDRDSWKVHFRDTMKGGKYLNQWRMAQIHAQEAPDRVNELEEWGAVFDRTEDGRILQRNFGGHSHPRLAHVGDRTGLELIRTLQDKGVHSGIDVHMECTVRRVLTTDGAVSGCVAYDRENGRFVVFGAKAVVLATGGIGQCWEVSSNSWEYTADGHALALWAGADLLDMEFVQFHPTGMMWPPSVQGTLITEGVRGEGGVLLNRRGKRFMFNYVPEMYKKEFADTEKEADEWVAAVIVNKIPKARRPPELLTRDVVARAIHREVAEGRGAPHGGVFLDIASRRPAGCDHPQAAQHVPPVQGAGRTWTSPRSRWKWARPATT